VNIIDIPTEYSVEVYNQYLNPPVAGGSLVDYYQNIVSDDNTSIARIHVLDYECMGFDGTFTGNNVSIVEKGVISFPSLYAKCHPEGNITTFVTVEVYDTIYFGLDPITVFPNNSTLFDFRPCSQYERLDGNVCVFVCSPGQFIESPSVCTNCSIGNYSTTFDAKECVQSDPGYYVSISGSNRQTPCEQGYYNNQKGMSTCQACAPGSYASDEATVECSLCELSFYATNPATVQCSACTGSRVTPFTGAILASDCLSPTPNFVTGFVTMFIAAILMFLYIAHGRFHRVAFLRKMRSLAEVLSSTKDISVKIQNKVLGHNERANAARAADVWRKKHVRMVSFLLSTVFVLAIVIMLTFVFVLTKVL
jgi:hypothetical protein